MRAAADTTGGAFTVFEENEAVDTPLHMHENEDELFFVLEGEHVFQVGEEEFRVGPGRSPCSRPAAFRTPSAEWCREPDALWSSPFPQGSRASSGSSRPRTALGRSGPRPTPPPPSATGSPG